MRLAALLAVAALAVACGSSAPQPVNPGTSPRPIGSTPRSMTEGGDCDTVNCADAPPCETANCVQGAPAAKPKAKDHTECSTTDC